MKTAIIPDVHNRTALADAALAAAGADQAIFLGDLFDDFGDDYLTAQQTARWVRKRMSEHPEDIWLFGNHDLPYAFGGAVMYPCPGWTPKKHHAVNRELEERHWRRFRMHVWEQEWLLSHAGLARWLFPFADNDPPNRKRSVIDRRCHLALSHSWRGEQDFLLSVVGQARGGRAEKGGIVWQCWSELDPILGVPQIVGHTPANEPRYRERPLHERKLGDTRFIFVREEDPDAMPVSRNACLDTHSQHFGLLEDGKLTIHRTPDAYGFDHSHLHHAATP